MRLRVLLLILFGIFENSLAEMREDQDVVTKEFYSSDIKQATTLYIQQSLDADKNFVIFDEKTGETLKLKFLEIHDPVRQISEEIYFACTDFYVLGDPEKIYDIDFWLDHDNVNLSVNEIKIHKEPRKSLLYGWYKHPRYTFVNDEIEYLY